MRDMSGIAVGIAAWGLVTGVAMVKSGLRCRWRCDVAAGLCRQRAAGVLPLMAAGAPLWVVWATALCVNLRFVIFSATWRPYLGTPGQRCAGLLHGRPELRDVHAPLSRAEAGARAAAVLLGRLDHQLAPGRCRRCSASCWPTRMPGALGHRLCRHAGAAGPDLLAAVDRATWIAAAVAGCAAVAAYALPLKLNIVVAIAAAVAIGLLMDHHGRAADRPHDTQARQAGGGRDMSLEGLIAIAGLAVLTLLTRGFFFLPERDCRCRPGCAGPALRAAGGAGGRGRARDRDDAGPADHTWKDARLFAAAAGRPTSSGAAASWAPSSPAWPCCCRCGWAWAGRRLRRRKAARGPRSLECRRAVCLERLP
jgi:hypothetical protein